MGDKGSKDNRKRDDQKKKSVRTLKEKRRDRKEKKGQPGPEST